MKAGIYALASLDGSPLLDDDLDALGLRDDENIQEVRTWACRVSNEQPDADAVDEVRSQNSVLLSLGYLDEIEEARAQLLDGQALSPAQVIAQTIDRFGAEAALRLVGNWSFVGWNAAERTLTLHTSLRIRDQLFWACNGKHIAVAPDQLALTRLSWVGRGIDPQGLALNVSDFRLRRLMTRETMWRGVSRVNAGWCMRFAHGAETEVRTAPEPEPIIWNGTFEEAAEELTLIGRRIVGQQMRRAGRSAFLLSGGLDSSLLTILGSLERSRLSEMFCLTSVASQGSGVPDEWAFSKSVAEARQVPIFPMPSPPANFYRPSDASFRHAGQPILNSRHYLYEALQETARTQGAHVIFDGVGGEYSLSTRRGETNRATSLRGMLSLLKRTVRQPKRVDDFSDRFLVRLAPDFLETLPKEWRGLSSTPWDTALQSGKGIIKGFEAALQKSAQMGSSAGSGARYAFPYFDYRLLRFASRLPNIFYVDDSSDRRLARAMVEANTPGFISQRLSGLPIAPEFLSGIAQQAQTAKARVPYFRDSGFADMLDLGWLGEALDYLGSGGNVYNAPFFQAPLTCMTAEFFSWLALK